MLVEKIRKTIVCQDCGKEKPIAEFYCHKAINGKVYASNSCKECKKARVKVIYYLSERNHRRRRRETRRNNRDDSQPQLFKVEDRTVYARLYLFDSLKERWTWEWYPIKYLPNIVECYQFVAMARNYSVAKLKRLARLYLVTMGDGHRAKILED